MQCTRFGCSGVGIPVDTKTLGEAIVGDVVGGALFGPIGSVIVGAASGVNGKNGKTKFVFNKCARFFEKKI